MKIIISLMAHIGQNMPATQETLDELDGGVRLIQPATGHRITSDSVDLARFVVIHKGDLCADLGAGTGVICILLAKANPGARFCAVEALDAQFGILTRNVALNGLGDRVRALKADAGAPRLVGKPGSFNVVFSNPPFRTVGEGRRSPSREKDIARTESGLSLDALLSSASKLLRERGRFYAIYPSDRLADLLSGLRAAKLEPKILRFIRRGKARQAKRVLVEAVKRAGRGLVISFEE
jgi:tRNA1Val (adenine37-N6)-methyltransferase